MGKIYLIRHGQTDSNAGKSFQGRIDNPLNKVGLREAELMAEYMSQLPLNAIYSSSLLRARQTAEALSKRCNLPYKPMDLLQEASFGEWEGVSFKELWEKYPQEMELFMTKPGEFTPPGGLSFLDSQRRWKEAIKLILEEQGQDKNIAIVAHGGMIRVILCTLLDCPLNSLWKFTVHNVSVSTVINWDGNMILDTINDYHFLEQKVNPKAAPSIV